MYPCHRKKKFFDNKFFLIKSIITRNYLGVNFYNSGKEQNAAFCPAVETYQGTVCELYPAGRWGREKASALQPAAYQSRRSYHFSWFIWYTIMHILILKINFMYLTYIINLPHLFH